MPNKACSWLPTVYYLHGSIQAGLILAGLLVTGQIVKLKPTCGVVGDSKRRETISNSASLRGIDCASLPSPSRRPATRQVPPGHPTAHFTLSSSEPSTVNLPVLPNPAMPGRRTDKPSSCMNSISESKSRLSGQLNEPPAIQAGGLLPCLAALALALTVPVREASGQGTVFLANVIANNGSPGLTTHIWGPYAMAPDLSLVGFGSNDTTTRLAPTNTINFAAHGMTMVGQPGGLPAATTFVQLLGVDAPTSALMPESSLVPVGQIATFRTQTSVAGTIVPITDTLFGSPGITAGDAFATFELVAWDNSSNLYSNWTQVSVAWQEGLIAAGKSGLFQVSAIGGGLNVVPYLNNMQDFNSFNLYFGSPPAVVCKPPAQTAEQGSTVTLSAQASGSPPLGYQWFLNGTNVPANPANNQMTLSNAQFSLSGAWTVVVTNLFGAMTSSPAMLGVIAPVERRPVPGVKVTGQPGSLWDVVCADSLSPAPSWTLLGSVSLSGTPQYYFDLTLPLPPQRFYRAQETADPLLFPVLDLHMVPAITLTGNIGDSVQVDCINRFGPIDAWVTLNTVTLTNALQLYFDVSAPGQPQRLYRLVPSP